MPKKQNCSVYSPTKPRNELTVPVVELPRRTKCTCILCNRTETTRGPYKVPDSLRVLIIILLGEAPTGLSCENARLCSPCQQLALGSLFDNPGAVAG